MLEKYDAIKKKQVWRPEKEEEDILAPPSGLTRIEQVIGKQYWIR